MKRYKSTLLSILLILALAVPSWAVVTHNCDYLTGGNQRALDYLSVSDLNNGDRAIVYLATDGILWFRYVASGVTAENTTTHPYIVRPNSFVAAGVWEEIVPMGAVGEINVLEHGAKGDGSTSDRLAIQNAVSACPTGGVVRIPRTSSYYKVDATSLSESILVSKSITIMLDGELRGTSGVTSATGNPPYVLNITGTDVIIRGDGIGTIRGPGTFNVDENTTDNIPGLVRLGHGTRIYGVNFIDPPETAIYDRAKDNIEVVGCRFTGGVTVASYTDSQAYYAVGYGGENKKYMRNQFYADSGGNAMGQGICYGSTIHAKGLIIQHNNFKNLHEHSTYLTLIEDSDVSHNIARYDQPDPDQVYTQAFKIGGYRIRAIGNEVYNAKLGAFIFYALSDSVVSGNQGYNVGYTGMLIGDNVANTTGLNRNTISHNVMYMRSSGTVYEAFRYGAEANMAADCVGVSFTDNIAYAAGGTTNETLAAFIFYHSGDSAYALKNFTISGNKAISPVRDAFYLKNIRDSRAVGNTVSGPQTMGSYFARLYGVTGFQFESNTMQDDQAATKASGFVLHANTANTNINFLNNNVFVSGASASLGTDATYNSYGRGNRGAKTQALTGIFTMNNVASATVMNGNFLSGTTTGGLSSLTIRPLNGPAGTVMGGTQSLFLSAIVAGSSFTVTTADGTNVAAVDATFAYEIVQ